MRLGKGSKAEHDGAKAPIDIENLTPDKAPKFFDCVRTLAKELGMEDEKLFVDTAIKALRRLNALNRAFEIIEKEALADEEEKPSKNEDRS